MKTDRFAAILSAAILALLAPAVSVAQGTVRQSTSDVNSPAQREMQSREWALTHVPDEVNKHFKKEQVSLFAQIREDFTRLQLVNNEMMQAVFTKNTVERKLIATAATEIKKRAVRLKDNLVLPKIDGKVKDEAVEGTSNDDRLRAGLMTLDHCIMSFVGNPIFTQPKVVDGQLTLRAREDLERIIHLSEQIKTLAQ
jgi:uncharacterized membrane-anchored protein YhcB (DUF1043 family)